MNRLRNVMGDIGGSLRRSVPWMICFLIGLIWAYNIAPTVFYDAHPSQLAQAWQDNWVTLVNDRYVSGNVDSAQLKQLLSVVDAPDEIATRLGLSPGIRELAGQAAPGAAPAPVRGSLISDLTTILLHTALFGGVAVLWQLLNGNLTGVAASVMRAPGRLRWLRLPRLSRPRLRLPRLPLFRKGAVSPTARATATAAAPRARRGVYGPLLRQETLYTMGMGEYDESFAIEDEYDNFLGECGAAVTETIGVNDPQVAAIEVWLFDKEDFVRTITHVFVTQHAINDPALRARIEPKVADGEMLLAQKGATTVLDTRALRLEARIHELEYGRGDLPANSHFSRLGLELLVYRKEGHIRSGSPQVSPPMQAPLEPMAESAGDDVPHDPFGGSGDFSPVG